MDDQLFVDTPSLEGLIERGLVTHLCTRDAGAAPDEAAVLAALCGAIAGEIYRIDSLNFVFRIEETDLAGTLAGVPFQKWGSLASDALLAALGGPAEPRPVYVRALVRSQPPLVRNAPPAAAEPETASPEVDETPEPAAWDQSPEPTAETEEEASPVEDWTVPDAMDADEAAPAADPADLAAAVEQVVAGIVEERFAALERRFDGLEAALSDLSARIADQTDATAAKERMLDDLVQECRKLPERTARHVAARADAMGPASIALAGVLQRLEARLDAPPDDAPVERALAALQAQLAAVAASAPDAPASDDTNARLAALEEELRRVPERAATHISARAASLAPLHVALSGTLHRLEAQIETLIGKAEAKSQPDADAELRQQIAEFLSRMERHFGALTVTPVARCRVDVENANRSSQ